MKLLYLSMLALVLSVSTVFALSVPQVSRVLAVNTGEPTQIFAPVPVLKSGQATVFPALSAQTALAVDLNSGVSLYEKDPDKRILPASTTKIVTALVVLDSYPLDQVVTIGDIVVDGQKMNLVKGEQITVQNLLYGLLVFSANDAAEALAANFPSGREAFIAAMNQKAVDLHLANSSFTNPAGLDDQNHYSTARDLVLVSEVAMANPIFAKIVGTKSIVIASADNTIKHNLTNVNQLLGEVEGVQGVKTGWTEAAQENLVTYLDRNNHKIMIAILGSQDRFGETKEMIDWIFNNYDWQEVHLP